MNLKGGVLSSTAMNLLMAAWSMNIIFTFQKKHLMKFYKRWTGSVVSAYM